MKSTKLIALLLLFLLAIKLNAQDSNSVPRSGAEMTLGLGLGLDHGGYGGNLILYPVKQVGFFISGGYAMAGFGVNGGLKIRFITDETYTIVPYGLAMYGYNAAIFVKNAKQYNKFFYGPSFGLGLDFDKNSNNVGYWSLAIIVPLRNDEVNDYIEDLKNNHGVKFKNDLFPIAFSFGFNFMMN
jgi:hypothetical protein